MNTFDETTFVPTDATDWFDISLNEKLSEAFIAQWADKVNWAAISRYQKLSEDFIARYAEQVDWSFISSYYKLSEAFIAQWADKVNWAAISRYYKLSEAFIARHADKVNWAAISWHQKLSEAFIERHKLLTPSASWHHTSVEEKIEYLAEHGQYEVVDGSVIAYKSVRDDGYSVINFQYQFEVGGTYECWADHNLDIENSFGLSAWTREKALKYYATGKLLKVAIPLEHLAAVVHDGGKLRASKMVVLEEVNVNVELEEGVVA